MRRIVAAILAIPVLAVLYLPVLRRRGIAIRAGLVAGAGLLILAVTDEEDHLGHAQLLVRLGSAPLEGRLGFIERVVKIRALSCNTLRGQAFDKHLQ